MIIAQWVLLFSSALLVRLPKMRRFALIAALLGCFVAVISHQISVFGIFYLLVTAALLVGAFNLENLALKFLFVLASFAACIALGKHKIPGFQNLPIVVGQHITPDAIPYTMYLNIDTVMMGLLVLFCTRPREPDSVKKRTIFTALIVCPATIAVVLGIALALHAVRLEPKIPSISWIWLLDNALIVALGEEALFRGFLQETLQNSFQSVKRGAWIAIGITAVVFGAYHYDAGLGMIALAAVAGVGYGAAYRYGGLQSSMLTHFGLNAFHFFLFTYPLLAHVAI